jgi:uncharacterized protein DUF3313
MTQIFGLKENSMKTSAMALSLTLTLLLGSTAVVAQDDEGAFLSDYSGLKPAADNPFDEIYIAPGALERASTYTAIMVDQPELFVHPESKYQGMKPDDMKLIADGLRGAITKELEGAYKIVDAPGPNVLYVRTAVGDLWLQKKKRSILSYTPAGMIIKAGKDMTKDLVEKIDLKNMKIEGEVLDSQSNEQLAAMTTSRGSLAGASAEGAEVTWDELTGLFGTIGKRLRCRLDNSRKPEAQWTNCGAIGLAAP